MLIVGHCRGCVTPKQLANLKETIGGNFDHLDGFDEITEEMQDKVELALKEGHVDDHDWNGVRTESNQVSPKDFTHTLPGCGVQQTRYDRHAEADPKEEASR